MSTDPSATRGLSAERTPAPPGPSLRTLAVVAGTSSLLLAAAAMPALLITDALAAALADEAGVAWVQSTGPAMRLAVLAVFVAVTLDIILAGPSPCCSSAPGIRCHG